MLPTEASHYDGEFTGDYWGKLINEDSPTAEHNANVEKKMNVAFNPSGPYYSMTIHSKII